MHADAGLIDEIVQRVLSELRTGVTAARPATNGKPPKESAANASPSAIVAIEAQVVTAEVLAQRPPGASRVRVRRRSILTPSARDFIRAHGLIVEHDTETIATPRRLGWSVIVSRATANVEHALEALRADIEFDRQLAGEPREAVDAAVGPLCRGEFAGAVVVTNEPELVACLANRNERIRAAVVRDAALVERLRISLQPDLLAIDPEGKSQFELKQLIRTIIAT